MKSSYIDITDLFCGAGGSSEGAKRALKGRGMVKIASNHWKLAVETHNTNFPDTMHDCADISQVDPRRYPTTRILIASPECTNHSLAKGVKRKNQGQLSMFDNNQPDPSEERSRVTMWDPLRFAEHHNYDIVIIENVVDARHWRMFDAWLNAWKTLDYDFQTVYLNSMFAPPTPQSRDRMYIVFWKKNHRKPDLRITPAAWCEHCETEVQAVQAWKNLSKQWGKYRQQYVYRCPKCTCEVLPYHYPAATAIDWSIEGQRIGDRKRPLKPRTEERIKYGIEKFSKRPIVVLTDHTFEGHYPVRSVDEAFPTQTARQVMGLAMPFWVMMEHSKQSPITGGVDEPFATQATRQTLALLTPFIVAPNDRSLRAKGVDEPLPTQLPARPGALVSPAPFLMTRHKSTVHRGTEEPLSTIVAGGNHHFLLSPPFISTFNRGPANTGIDEALPTIVTNPHQSLLVPPFLVAYNGSANEPRSVTEEMATVTTIERHGLAVPEESLDYEDWSFRMLQSHEIKAGMAFPSDYVLLGTQREQVRLAGNAVTPPVMQILIERCIDSLE